MTTPAKMAKLVAELAAAREEYSRLAFDEEEPVQLAPPCSAMQLARMKDLLGGLPASYASFLKLHNGWPHFDGFEVDKILAVEDYHAPWVEKRMKWLGSLFGQFGKEDPFAAGAVPLVLGEDEKTYAVFDTRQVHANGEMDIVEFDLTVEDMRHASFEAFLRYKLELLRELIAGEKAGEPDDA